MNIGIIGVGNWGNRVAKEYIELAKEGIIESVSICEKNQELLEKYSNFHTSNNYNEFLKNKLLDGVHLCAPNELHYEIAKTAILNNKHVLIEKPFTINSNEAYKLIELSSEHGVILQVGHIYRFANVIRLLKKLIEQDHFGDIKYITFKWTNFVSPSQENIFYNVDIIWDLLPHILDIIHFTTDKYPIKIDIYRKQKQMTVLNLDYDSFIANVELSWITPERKRELNLIGSKRSAKVECVKQKLYVFENETKKGTEWNVESNNTIKDEALNFISAIKNKKMMYNSHIIGAKIVDIIEKIVNGNKNENM